MKKKSKNTCRSYGLTQSEMATILGISRAQWSMHESKARSLPVHAMASFRKMNEHIDTGKLAKQFPSKDALDNVREAVSRLLRDNTLAQARLIRKIDSENASDAVVERQRHIIDFLGSGDNVEYKGIELVRQLLKQKVNKVLDSKRLSVRMEMEIRLEVLRFEEQLLLSRFEK